MPPKTIISLKQDFLQSQTTLLQTPPLPSEKWLTHHLDLSDNAPSATPALPPRVVKDVIHRLETLSNQHFRRVYAPAATRHVAEQIDKLYWMAGERGGQTEQESLGRWDDLSTDEAITKLPETSPVPLGPQEASYKTLLESLQTLSHRRSVLHARIARLQALQKTLAPISQKRPHSPSDEAASKRVQDNLVTRNSKVEKELEKMRVLLARVGGRVGKLRGVAGSSRIVMPDVQAKERKKVDDFLEKF